MSPNKTSKERFAEFRDKYNKGEFRHESDDQKNDDDNKPKKLSSEQKQKRRSYLRLYIRKLWPHWKLVTVLTFLALVVSALDLVQPLFARHIIDKVLLADGTTSEKIWNLNLVGGLYLIVVVIARLAVFTDQAQYPRMGVVLIDQLPLGRHIFQLLEHRIGTVSYPLDQIPLGRIRYRHAH